MRNEHFDFRSPPKFDFFKQITTQTGIIQHTKYGIPDREYGYSLDDNARALIVAVKAYQLFKDKDLLGLINTYLSFLIHSKKPNGFFYNFQRYDGKFMQDESEDAYGETIWSLGCLISANVRKNLTLAAFRLFDEVRHNIERVNSLRSISYIILGLYELTKVRRDKQLDNSLLNLGERMLRSYQNCKSKNWHWFENYLTYANAILIASLAYIYLRSKDKRFLNTAKESFAFLEKECRTKSGVPRPIGSNGWYFKGGKKAIFDQQPIEAAYNVVAGVALFKATKSETFLQAAKDWFAWFHGNNIKNKSLIDPETGGCFDAIQKKGINLNMGAESVISYLLAYLTLAEIEKNK